jgi:hypothetical protein
MERKIQDLKEMIELKQSVIQSARACDREILEEELNDIKLTLKLLEIAKINEPHLKSK